MLTLVVMLMPMPMPVRMVIHGRKALRAALDRPDAVRIALRHQQMAVACRPARLRQHPLFGRTPLEVCKIIVGHRFALPMTFKYLQTVK
jgi:hypothetical protein